MNVYGNFEYNCSVESHQDTRYLRVTLNKGDIIGQSDKFKDLMKEIKDKTAEEGINEIIINIANPAGLIDSTAIGKLVFLEREKYVVFYGLSELQKTAIARISQLKVVNSEQEALESIIASSREIE